MGKIETILSLKDMMSPALKEIIANMDKLTTSMNSLKAIDELADNFDKSADAAKFLSDSVETAGNTISDTEIEFQNLGDAAGDAANDIEKTGDELGNIPNQSSGLTSVPSKFNNIGKSVVIANQALELMQKLISGIVGSFSNMREIYISNSRASTQLQVVLANNLDTVYELDHAISAVNQTANEIERATGIAAGSMVSGAAELAKFTDEVETVEILMHSIADFAVGSSKDLNITAESMSDYANKIGMAMQGNYRQLERSGVVLNESQKKILEYGTEIERALVISDAVGDSWDGLAETMGTTAVGAIARFERQVESAQSLVGQVLVELQGAFLNWIMALGFDFESMIIGIRTAFIDNLHHMIKAGQLFAKAFAVFFAIKMFGWATILAKKTIVGAKTMWLAAQKWRLALVSLKAWAIKLLPVTLFIAALVLVIVTLVNLLEINTTVLGV